MANLAVYSPDDVTIAELENRFTGHGIKKGQPERFNHLREHMLLVAKNVQLLCPPGREQSIALTKIEEAFFWAIHSISRNE